MNSRDTRNDPLPEGVELNEALRKYRDGIASRIREANGMTEREVLAAGEALRLIVEEARNFVQGSQHTLEDIASSSVSGMLDRHRSLMNDFVAAMQSQVEVQNQAAQQATDQINRIVDLGRSIQYVTTESRMLALNANIQARRLGNAGRAFQVIGQEMKQFSETVNDANKGVQALAESLLDALPRIQDQAAKARELSEQFSKDINARMLEVALANTHMKERIAESMAAGETRLQQILKLSYDALSHLQFQDPVAQSLNACERDVGECMNRAVRWANGEYPKEEIQEPEPAVSAEDSLESGDIVMF
jgi:methyl-accepting chemotaxis protein